MGASSSRRRQSASATLFEVGAGGGAAVGVLIAAAHSAKRRRAPVHCRGRTAGMCLGHHLAGAIHPYLEGALIGLAIGGSVAVVALLAWVWLRTALARRSRPAAAVAAAGQRGHSGGSVRASGRSRRQPIPERIRNEVWRRDEACCVDCGSRERLEFDHIIPVSRGGSNTARNIELRCERCNGQKGARI